MIDNSHEGPRYIYVAYANETACPACKQRLVIDPDDYFPKPPHHESDVDNRFASAITEAWSTAWSKGLKPGIDVLLEWLE